MVNCECRTTGPGTCQSSTHKCSCKQHGVGV